MAGNTVRKVELEPKKRMHQSGQQTASLVHKKNVKWSLSEKFLLITGTLIVASMMIFLISTNIKATTAQHNLTNVEQAVTRQQNETTDLQQEIGKLTSGARMNKIARQKGLTLIEKNIRTIN